MATKKATSKSKSGRMPGFFESGPVAVTRRPAGYAAVMKEMKKGKK